jgi:4-amino-4-deoxy-L-arabinose transferase-like glycosyltransferase
MAIPDRLRRLYAAKEVSAIAMSREGSSVAVSARGQVLFAWGLTALVILGAILRLHDLGQPAFDCDELYAIRIQGFSLKSIASIVGRAAFHEPHPPLAYLVYLPWVSLFGTAEVAVRSLPLLLGVASVALIGLVGRRIGGTGVGLAAAALLATNPLHIAFSQEARSYSLAVLLVITAHLFFLRSLGEPSARNRIVYALLVVAAVYTHYFALLAVLAHGLIALWLLLTGDEDSRRAARRTLLAFGCGMATFIAWLPALAVQITGKALPLDYLAIQGSPLGRAVSYMEKVVGLGTPPFLLLATAALLVLLVSAFLGQKRLPAAASEAGSGDFLPRKFGVLLLVAGLLLAAGLRFAAPRYLLPTARQILLSQGYGPDAVEQELHGLLQFTVSVPLALGVIGLLVLGWPWLSSLPDRLRPRTYVQGRPLAVNVLLAALLLVPLAVALAFALKGTPLLSPRNLLICEPPLALALALGAVRLAQTRLGRFALVPLALFIALARFQYQPVSGIVGLPGIPMGIQTGAWRDLVQELDRMDGKDLPLVMLHAPGSDPAEFYLHDRSVTRLPKSGGVMSASLPAEFRFVHLKGDRGSEALLSRLSGVVPLRPRLQVDEFVIYDARPSLVSRIEG